MKRIYLFLIALIGTLQFSVLSSQFSVGEAFAQVSVEARIDSLQILIGQQTGVTLEVSCGAKQLVELPVYQPGQMMTGGVEVVSMNAADTTLLDEGRRMTVSRKYIVTSFDVEPLGDTLFSIPPLKVKVDGKEYLSKNLALKVYSMDVDTLHVDRYCGPKDVMNAPFAWEDWRMVVWGGILFVLLCICIVVMSVSLYTGKPIIRIIRRKVKEPAHKIALSEIEKIKSERTWAQEDSKEYYTQLTDTLRTYIQDRYGFNAMEMTSGEIVERLMDANDEETLNDLRELFHTADLVKFAKWTTLINENDANLMTALEYINQTKQEVDPNQPQEEIIVTPEAKRQRVSLWVMRITIAVASIVATALVAWVIYRIIDLLR